MTITVLPRRHCLLATVVGMMQTWIEWRAEVVSTLRAELELVDRLSFHDVDWVAWFGFYLESRSKESQRPHARTLQHSQS